MHTAVVTDSTSGFMPGQNDGIAVVPLHFHFDDETFSEGVDMSPDEFWARMKQLRGAPPTTSQPAPGAFRDAYAQLADQHDDLQDILSFHISSSLSGTLNSARQGAALLADERDNAPTVHTIDSRSASVGLGWGVEAALDAVRDGADPQQAAATAARVTANTRLLLFVETLDFLLAGGRIGRARHLAGKLLRMRPLLELLDGVIIDVERPRTRRKAIDRLFAQIMANGAPARVAIMHGDAEDDAHELAQRVSDAVGGLDILIGLAPPVLGAHVGPGTVGAAVLTQSDD